MSKRKRLIRWSKKSYPSIGEMKIGDLSGVQVYKYKLNTQQYLVAYQLKFPNY
ncbi:type II toxin-antitoxin system RelE/ParE family toxin [Bathymodiolus platifrons methanotrophic gill symbiont]|uniref:type II toxin-antitoxin system RelE/ParE family toxin n=1 Tax=Bathymodiolus platifrons methanotrophic gill symbiont TaxID=113268 RepID=UPI001124EB06